MFSRFTPFQQLWDFVYIVESCVNSWKKTAWKKLDVEEIEQQCKKFSKEVRILGKAMRNWEPFVYIEKMLRDLVTSLRAITELQNSAIRDRHWLELMRATGVRFLQFQAVPIDNLTNPLAFFQIRDDLSAESTFK